jgi:CheY-like chemotaxis protein
MSGGLRVTMDRKTILIADDDSDLADALAKRCEHLGLKAVLAYDGLSTLRGIAQCPPDIVCLDLNMPFGGGMDVCRALAEDAVLSSVPIIVLTGRSDAETIRYCRSMGVHYVLKSRDVWSCVEPLIRRLLDLAPGGRDGREVAGEAISGLGGVRAVGPACAARGATKASGRGEQQ